MHVPKHGSTQHVQRHHVDHVGLVFGMLSTIMLSCIWYARTSLASRSQLEGPSPRDGREGGEERRNARYTKWRAPAPRDHVASRSQHATRQTMQHRHQRNELLQLHTSSWTGKISHGHEGVDLGVDSTILVHKNEYRWRGANEERWTGAIEGGISELFRERSGVLQRRGYMGASSVVEEPRRGPGSVYRPRTRDCASRGGAVGRNHLHANKTPRSQKAVVNQRAVHERTIHHRIRAATTHATTRMRDLVEVI